jgi:putative pyruvate formate lyase activating enzyme
MKARVLSLPAYRRLAARGELGQRAAVAWALAEECRLCPTACGTARLLGRRGRCGADARMKVAAACLHGGEEPPLSGSAGSGTVFFSQCPLQCCYCQNFQISHEGVGEVWGSERLAGAMLSLQTGRAHNLNLVTASHYLPVVLQALQRASDRGLRLPLVYNTSGYESLEVLALLRGVVDIYLVDAKYADEKVAERLSAGRGYVAASRAAIFEMVGQVGFLQVGPDGVARRGALVRHLVLPGRLAGTRRVIGWLAETFGPDIPVSLMAHYRPSHLSVGNPPLDRALAPEEYAEAVGWAEEVGLRHLYIQEVDSASCYLPDFRSAAPFDIIP